MLLNTYMRAPEWLPEAVVRYSLAVPVCFGTGFLASYTTALVPALAWLATSFSAFWYMLRVMLRMLRVGEAKGAKTGNAPQFVAIRIAIVFHHVLVEVAAPGAERHVHGLQLALDVPRQFQLPPPVKLQLRVLVVAVGARGALRPG